MSAARSAILGRVKRALMTGRLPPTASNHRHQSATRVEAMGLERFLSELDALGVAHHVASTAGEVRSIVSQIVNGRSVFAWDPDRLPYDIGQILGPSSITGANARDVQASAEIGVTGCHAAIVETGSLAVLSGRGTPRAASLLPPMHLCIVRPADLCSSVAEFFRTRADDIAAAACCTFITGPSRTADIELTLTLGVHGPGVVIVVVGP